MSQPARCCSLSEAVTLLLLQLVYLLSTDLPFLRSSDLKPIKPLSCRNLCTLGSTEKSLQDVFRSRGDGLKAITDCAELTVWEAARVQFGSRGLRALRLILGISAIAVKLGFLKVGFGVRTVALRHGSSSRCKVEGTQPSPKLFPSSKDPGRSQGHHTWP